LIVAALVLATLLAIAVGAGNPALALAPAAAVALGALLLRAPGRLFGFGLLALVLVVDSPQDRPADGMWSPPLLPLGQLLFQPLGGTLGVPVPFTLLDLLVMALATGALVRAHGAPRPQRTWAAGLGWVLGAYLVALVGLCAWGMARGGELQAAYWQLRQMALLPLVAFGLHHLWRGTAAELGALGKVVVGAALFKAALGGWFFYVVAVPQGLAPAYVTTHADSVLFVGALMIVLLVAVQAPSRRSLVTLALVAPALLWALYLNDRRIAWVELLLALTAVWWLMHKDASWRRFTRVVLWLAPALLLYAAVGWGSTHPVFTPLRALGSVNAETDSSTFAREVENHNLALTVRTSPLIGLGYGHGYREFVHHEIGRSFELYRHMPHNAVYALFMIGGVLGFAVLWLPLPFAVFLAVRAHRRTTEPPERAAALGCVAAVMLFALQAWGDMGTQSYPPVFLLACALAVASRLAVKVGAWPSVAQAESSGRTAWSAGEGAR
jgi:hypothetical protein